MRRTKHGLHLTATETRDFASWLATEARVPARLSA